MQHEVEMNSDGAQRCAAILALNCADKSEEKTHPNYKQTPNDEQIVIFSVINRTQYNMDGTVLGIVVQVGNRELSK